MQNQNNGNNNYSYGNNGYNNYNGGGYNGGGWKQPGHDEAIISLILGIVGIVACSPCGIAALIFANKAKRLGNNEGIMTAGKILGIIGVVLLGITIIGLFLYFFVFAIVGVGMMTGL